MVFFKIAQADFIQLKLNFSEIVNQQKLPTIEWVITALRPSNTGMR